jgi:hypothetical protein
MGNENEKASSAEHNLQSKRKLFLANAVTAQQVISRTMQSQSMQKLSSIASEPAIASQTHSQENNGLESEK